MTITLLIADDHEVVRSGLKSLVAETDIKVIAEADTGDEAVRLALDREPDVVLLDIRMSEGDGLKALGRIKIELPELPVLIFSTYDNPTYVARAVALGACGYLLKGASSRDLIEVGAYQPGSDAEVDRAITIVPHLDAFRRQDLRETCVFAALRPLRLRRYEPFRGAVPVAPF